MNKELIEQIRNGKALHYDIDNVELLNEVLNEAFPNQGEALGRYKYYYSFINGWACTNSNMPNTIPLSSFLDTPKMISVEAVKEKLNEMIRDYQDEGNSDNSNINNRVIGAIRACNQLLTFLNTHTNVK